MLQRRSVRTTLHEQLPTERLTGRSHLTAIHFLLHARDRHAVEART
jgi:hypothetical protein